jgi:hypothetical protein
MNLKIFSNKIMISKEVIITHLKEVYIKSNKIPTSSETYPFSVTSVKRICGSWNNALIEANIPLRIDKTTVKLVDVTCKNCNKTFKKYLKEIKRSLNNYCSSSCSAIYNNKHKTTGFRVSKLEIYLQENLKGYNFDFNNRIICYGLELDIYIDDLKLAFEINGIVHYKPIYGKEKFDKIVKKDILKNKLSKDKGIILYTIKDESNKFSINHGEKILQKIYRFIHKLHFKETLKYFISRPTSG